MSDNMFGKNVEVSVICLTYNQKDYISQTIKSIVSQKTSFNFELIIHDDASTDGTKEIIKEYSSKYNNIVPVFEIENQYSKGIPITQLLSANLAKGKYIALCEGDDFWTDENKLELQYKWMESHDDCALVVCEAIRVNRKGEFIKKYSCYFAENQRDMGFKDVVDNLGAFPYCSMFYKRSFDIENLGFFYKVKPFDYILKILLATYGKVHCLPKEMAAYRVDAKGSWSVNVRNDNLKLEEHIKESITGLTALKEYISPSYSEPIKLEIKRREFAILRLKKSDRCYNDAYYADVFEELSFKHKIIVLLEINLPFIFKCIMRINSIVRR